MTEISALVEQHGYLLVFAAVLIEQVGVPLPAFPVLVIAGALVANGALSAPMVLALAVVAALAGDLLWFQFGRAFGSRVLGWMCRLSLSPDRCVSDAERAFGRLGLKALLVTRFVPGLGAVAPSLAGLSGYTRLRFALFDGLGATLWAGTALALGIVLHREVEGLLAALAQIGPRAIGLIAAVFALFILWKAWRRRRLAAVIGVPRIQADELRRMLDSPASPLVLDLRSPPIRSAEPAPIPGAVGLDAERLDEFISSTPRDRPIVVVCACPGEAYAAKIAARLRARGFARTYALAGGFAGWLGGPEAGPGEAGIATPGTASSRG